MEAFSGFAVEEVVETFEFWAVGSLTVACINIVIQPTELWIQKPLYLSDMSDIMGILSNDKMVKTNIKNLIM